MISFAGFFQLLLLWLVRPKCSAVPKYRYLAPSTDFGNLSAYQKPLIAAAPVWPKIKPSDTLVDVVFTSVAHWPESGEQKDYFTIPLGRWVRPGDSAVLKNPIRIQLLGLTHHEIAIASNDITNELEKVVCRMYSTAFDGGYGPTVTLQLGDEELDLDDGNSLWYMGRSDVDSFGCVLV